MKSTWVRKLYLLALMVLTLSVLSGSTIAQAAEEAPAHKEDMGAAEQAPAPAHKDDMGEMSRKLSDPTSDIWALQGEFDYIINKGDLSDHSTKNQYQFLFQPITPIPLTKNWKILTRPVVPIVSTAMPRLDIGSFNYHRNTGLGTRDAAARSLDWFRKAGIGDTDLPLMLSPRKKPHWMLALGPTFSFPTATDSNLGPGLPEVGPAAVIGFKT